MMIRWLTAERMKVNGISISPGPGWPRGNIQLVWQHLTRWNILVCWIKVLFGWKGRIIRTLLSGVMDIYHIRNGARWRQVKPGSTMKSSIFFWDSKSIFCSFVLLLIMVVSYLSHYMRCFGIIVSETFSYVPVLFRKKSTRTRVITSSIHIGMIL